MIPTINQKRYLSPRFGIKQKGQDKRKKLLFNLLAFLIVTSVFIFIGWGGKEMVDPISTLQTDPIALDYEHLFEYSLKTALRMLLSIIVSLIFTFIYAPLAAKNKYAEQFLIPLLDILQSVPILGYISFTIAAFMALLPGNLIGPECAAIFAIFSSQVWNMTFSVYQSLKTVPSDLMQASFVFNLSPWQRFWRVEIPYALPGLIWNTVISVSSGWFFVVAAEVIVVGNNHISLPGLGSYISLALEQKNILAIFHAIIAMIIIILIYDQLLFKPLIAWSEKFRYDTGPVGVNRYNSWAYLLYQRSSIVHILFMPIKYIASKILYFSLLNKRASYNRYGGGFDSLPGSNKDSKLLEYIWYGGLVILGAWSAFALFSFLFTDITFSELLEVLKLSCITLLRIVILITIASIIWVPVGVYVGLRPNLAKIVQPLTQFVAAFPVNLLFPIVVIGITHYDLDPDIWLSPLMVISTQWYILFNVIAGALSLPNELKEAAIALNIRGMLWWRKVMLPTIAPYFVTGAITAYGGSWNASIVAEIVNFGSKKIIASGLGSYITEMTVAADYHRITLGIVVMVLFVVVINRIFWQPLYDFVTKKYQISS